MQNRKYFVILNTVLKSAERISMFPTVTKHLNQNVALLRTIYLELTDFPSLNSDYYQFRRISRGET